MIQTNLILKLLLSHLVQKNKIPMKLLISARARGGAYKLRCIMLHHPICGQQHTTCSGHNCKVVVPVIWEKATILLLKFEEKVRNLKTISCSCCGVNESKSKIYVLLFTPGNVSIRLSRIQMLREVWRVTYAGCFSIQHMLHMLLLMEPCCLFFKS